MSRPQPRRAPQSAQRQRDPERSRKRILEAAIEELSDKGLSGLRVAAIAARAGVNKQLISYYFGGKDGLLRAIGDRWREQKRAYDVAGWPLTEVIAQYVRAAAADRTATRLVGWQGLNYTGPADDPDQQARAEQVDKDLADLERRQELGELDAGLDLRCLYLALVAASSAPVLLPHMAQSICGADADSPEFVERYAAGISELVARLGPRPN